MLFVVASLMAVHALLVGRYLGSAFFITAFPCGWVAIAALRRDLAGARAMCFTMLCLIPVYLLSAHLLAESGASLVALYSLAAGPALVCWLCLLALAAFIEQGESDASGSPVLRAGILDEANMPVDVEEALGREAAAPLPPANDPERTVAA